LTIYPTCLLQIISNNKTIQKTICCKFNIDFENFASGQHLRIQDVKMYDRGQYDCRAENRLGTSEVSAFLTVEEQPVPITITTPPHDATAPRGATVQMPCRAEGSPEPKIRYQCEEPCFEILKAYFQKKLESLPIDKMIIKRSSF
jgi:hypothetical protein